MAGRRARIRIAPAAPPTPWPAVALIFRIRPRPASLVVPRVRVIVVAARPISGTAWVPRRVVLVAMVSLIPSVLVVTIAVARPIPVPAIVVPAIGITIPSLAHVLVVTRILFRQVIVGQIIPGRRPKVSSSYRRQVSSRLITIPAFNII